MLYVHVLVGNTRIALVLSDAAASRGTAHALAHACGALTWISDTYSNKFFLFLDRIKPNTLGMMERIRKNESTVTRADVGRGAREASALALCGCSVDRSQMISVLACDYASTSIP
ncbi:hypothetical protein EVAR_58793_1 [Eumeta japonica]|uniref:Uncharacterized protein n=1 Tax=Eumeta variegata TaxID=151549 RepID=A0A4C1YKX0_EUMVA|nr:hypothetical protein EVAR_58793_1 [Eumeta japonica]